MISIALGVLCALVALSALSLLKTYQHIPAREVKRMARSGDATASVLYKPIAYGANLSLVLWLIVGLAIALSLLLFANALPFWLSLLVAAAIIWAGFAWIPGTDLSNFGILMARKAAGPL